MVALSKELTRDEPRTLDTVFLVDRRVALIGCSMVLIGGCVPFSTYAITVQVAFSTTRAVLGSRIHGYLILNKIYVLDLFEPQLRSLFEQIPRLLDAPGWFYRGIMTVAERHKANILKQGLRPITLNTHPQEFFEYNSIHDPRHIRLLSLQPCLISFKAMLITEPLDFAQSFDAISYTWGETNSTHELLVDGKPLRIPRNTADIIRQRALLWKPRLLWIDAICINQNNVDDKNQQVRMMRDIYKASSRTIVALGDAPDGDLLFQFMDELALYNTTYHPADHTYRETMMIKEENSKWLALRRLMNHGYWKRAWVIQEVVMAKSVHINYAGNWYEWEFFARIMYALEAA
jgi:hypothetical protein